MFEDIDRFILFLATEKGLSTAYQLSTRRSLESFATWAGKQGLTDWTAVQLPNLTSYLAERKKSGLATASIRLLVIALKMAKQLKAEMEEEQDSPIPTKQDKDQKQLSEFHSAIESADAR